ncbi:uncharacterized protein [Nicotiana tomentosiformis]|uniref:uncharacterized protein n=1 Tax=Nicotiana tomentosiformis TaxID=4098 RepID=UPI00388C8C2D
MEFTRLSQYAILMLPTMESRVRRFMQDLSPLVINEAATAALNSDMNYGKMVAFSQATENQASPDVVTCILDVQSHDVYALIDPGSTLSYVTPYVVMEFGIEPEQLPELFYVSTLVGKSIVAAWVYRGCVVTVRGQDIVANLIELGMVDFDVIVGMDWVYSCFAKLDCRTRTVRIPPEREIDFGIDVMPGTQPISIPKYRMAPAELKELKEQLKDLLEKGFIPPSVSPWGTLVLFVRKKVDH